jgi:hypothetical protein
MLAATKPLQTSASELKTLLCKAGRPLKSSDGTPDKLEVCGFLAEQINWVLRHKGKMQLTLDELKAFLDREEVPADADFKSAVSKIILLVHLQKERLIRAREDQQSAGCNTGMIDNLLALVAMDKRRVDACFERESETLPVTVVDSVAEALASSAEPAAKRVCLGVTPANDATPDEATLTSNLVAELKRLVPVNMLAIANVEHHDHATANTLSERQATAKAEINRILQAHADGLAILNGKNAEERRTAFRHIVLLLHPDLGLISGDDMSAMQALDLSLKAFVRSEVQG